MNEPRGTRARLQIALTVAVSVWLLWVVVMFVSHGGAAEYFLRWGIIAPSVLLIAFTNCLLVAERIHRD
jgi:hypothetical protein